MNDSEGGSVPQNKRRFTVAASPLNPAKLELGLILFVGIFLLFSVGSIFESQATQIAVLLSYGLISMIWLIIRVRRIMQNLDEKTDG